MCPLIQCQRTCSWSDAAASSASQISLFFTGSPAAVFQFLRFHPAIHEVIPSCR